MHVGCKAITFPLMKGQQDGCVQHLFSAPTHGSAKWLALLSLFPHNPTSPCFSLGPTVINYQDLLLTIPLLSSLSLKANGSFC